METKYAPGFVAELPAGDWTIQPFGDTLILTCPDHQPRIVKDGKAEILEPMPAGDIPKLWKFGEGS